MQGQFLANLNSNNDLQSDFLRDSRLGLLAFRSRRHIDDPGFGQHSDVLIDPGEISFCQTRQLGDGAGSVLADQADQLARELGSS